MYATDPYLLKEASLIASRALPEEERGFGFSTFDLDGIEEKPSFDQIADVLNTMPFMGGRRIVVVENIQELGKNDREPLQKYVSDPSPYSVLILLHRGNPKGQMKELTKKVKAILLDLRQQDFPLWIKDKARQRALVLTDRAIEYLLGVVGPDVGLLSSELEKCTLIGKSPIDRDDLLGVVSGSGDYNVFDLVDAIKDKNIERVFKIAKALQGTADPYSLLGAINWYYSRMSTQDKSRTAYYDRVFGLLNEADIGIKTSGGTFPLEYLLMKLLQV
jgi:DNA polymerase-3 subunit delta